MSGLRVEIRPASRQDFGSMSNEELFRAAGMQPPSGNRSAGSGGGGQAPVSSMSDDELFAMAGIAPNRVQQAHSPASAQSPWTQSETEQLRLTGERRMDGREKPTALDAFGRGMVQSATLNFGDEISGAAAASGIPQAISGALGNGPVSRVINSATTLPAAIVGGARMAGEAIAPSVFGNSATPEYGRVTGLARRQQEDDSATQWGASLAGNVVGGLVPALAAPIAPAATAAGRFMQGAGIGAGFGAAYGAGDGEDLASRTGGAAVGGLVGGVLGGGINAAIGPRIAAPRPSSAGPAGPEVVAAAERIGVQLPTAVASDSITAQRMGAGVRNIPIFGNSLVTASQRAQGQMNDAANRIAGEMGAVSRAQAGETTRLALRDWTTTQSRAIADRVYGAVDRAITNPTALTPLNSLQGTVANLLAKRANANFAGESRAIQEVADAIRTPGGMNYQGIKDLRSHIGELLKPGMLPQGASDVEMRAIYGALSDDLRSAVRTGGGALAERRFEAANAVFKRIQERRDQFARIIGEDGNAPAEQIFDQMIRMASDQAGGNLSRLAQARRVMDPADWQEVSGTLISRMGRNEQDVFTPDRFLTAWGRLSDQGKSVLFGGNPSHRQALDDLATVSSRFKLLAQFGNPSGTAQNVGVQAMVGGGTIGTAMAAPIPVIASAVGTLTIAKILAMPATATSMARWSRAYENALVRPGASTVSALQSASRNFANTIGERLGVTVDPMDFLRAIQGAQPIRAEGEQSDQQ